MARVMTLDGLDQGHIGAIRAQLDAGDRSWLIRPVELSGFLEPAQAHPLWILGGLIAGVLIASSGLGLFMRKGLPWLHKKKRR